ncbi:hypothetical protein FS594_09295 [Rahnella aquatilis]|nr:hypothetical protein FS594_09295 [Rahnella aquatilis]
MANKTIFINDSSVVDLKQFGNKEQAHFIISGTDLKFIFSDGATVNIVNGALYSSLEHSKVVFSFTDGDISGQNLLKSIDLSNLELERLDSSLSEDRQARVIKENADTKTEDEVNRLEEVNKEADKLRKEAEGLRAEAEEARKAANEVEQELQEFLDNKAKNKVSTNGSGVSNESGEEQEAASFKKKKYDEEGVAESERLKLEDNNSSSSSSSSKTSEKTGDEVIVKPVDISLKLDDKSDSGTKNDNITNIASPSFIGSTAPNANIILKIDGIVVAVVQSDNMGNFVADVASELPDGQHTIQADVEDGQGGSGSAKILVTIDTVTEIPTFELSSQYSIPVEDQIPDENLTRFTNAKIIGTAEAGVSIDIYINDILLTTVKTDAEGNWSYQFSGNELQEGINGITVVATDKADNSASTTGIITLDTIPPETPTIILDESSDTGLYSDDKITNDVTPGFRGKAGPDSIVELYVNGYKIADVTADSKGDWSYTLDSNVIFMDGTYNVQVIASDRAGNTASNAIDIEIDTNIDAFSIQIEAGSDSGNAADNYTNVASPIFTGKTDSFSHISITNTTTGETLETDASQSGNYTFRFSGESAEGVNQLIITVVDLAGNAQDYDFSYTIDTIAPVTPTIALDDYVISQSGATLTNDTTPLLVGTGEAGSHVSVYIDGKKYATVAVTAEGTWSVDVAPGLKEGEHKIVVEAQDIAGNVSLPSEEYIFSVDTLTQKPVAALDTDDDTGSSQNDWITNHNDNLLVTGVAEKYVTITLMLDGKEMGKTTADEEGHWSFEINPNPGLADDNYSVEIIAMDEVGNISSSTYELVIDTVTSTPTIMLDADSDTGITHTDGITKDPQPLFKGVAEVGAEISLMINGTYYGSAIADKNGNWSFRIPADKTLAEGEYNVMVTAVDIAGNSANSVSIPLIIDLHTDIPTIDLLSDSGDNPDDHITSVNLPSFAGTAEPFASITLYCDGNIAGKASADAKGQWQFTYPQSLPEGSYAFHVSVVDVAGNIATSEKIHVTIDTSLNIPSVDLLNESDSGASATDNITNTKSPIFVLNSVDSDVTHVLINIDGTDYPASLNNGVWSLVCPVELADGIHTITATVTDLAGNSATSGTLDVTVDTAISAPLITLSDDTGVAGDNQTNDTTPGFAIATDSDVVTVTVSVDGGAAQAAVQDSAGQWHFTVPAALADGEHNLVVTVTDTAGNSTSGEAFAFTVDTTLSLPVIDLTDASDSGADMTDNITNNATPAFTLSQIAADAVTVEVLINGTVYPATQTGGIWGFTAPELTDGDYAVQVRVTDDAGNVATSGALDVTVDTAISAPLITLSDDTGVAGDNQTNDTTPGFAIVTDADVVTVLVSVDGGAAQAAVRDSAGQWHFTVPSALADGEHNLVVTVTDTAGNSTSGEPFAFTVDTTLSLPVIDLNDGSDTGASTTDNITNNATPAFTLSNVDADAVTVEVLINGTVYPATQTGGIWGFTAPELTDGDYSVQVRVTDDAGNVAISGALDVTVDTAISAPVVTLSDDTGVAGDNQTNDTTPGFAIATDSDVVTVLVSIDGGAAQAAVRDSAGQWHFTVPSALADGEHNLVVTVTDTAGNSTSGEAFAFTVDTTLSLPVIDLTDASDSGADMTDNITNNATPAFNLSNVDADAVTVEVLINGTVYPATQTGGIWGFTAPELTDGNYSVQVRVTDDAGNVAISGALNMTVDTAISAPGVTLSDDTGVAGDNQTNDTTPGFAIATDSDVVTVTVSVDGGAAQAAVRDSAGQWHFTVPSALTDGEHNLVVTVTDTAGNSTSGEAFAFTVDTTLSLPVIDLNDGSDTGASTTDNITNNATPAFTLSNVDADAVTVEVLINGTVYPATQTGGIWGFTAPELTDGDYAVQVRVTDDAGNVATSGALNMTVDTAISAPVVTLSDDTGVAGDNQTNDTTPGFAIVTDADVVVVTVSVDGGAAQAAVRDSEGQWHFAVPAALADGEHNLVVTVTDTAGNSTSGEAFAFTVDTTLSVPVIDLTDASDSGADMTDNITNNTTPAFTLSNVDADAVTVEVLINGTVYPATQTGDSWSFTAPELTDGDYSVQVRVTDDAGNVATSGALDVTVDTAISAPVVTLSDDTGVAGDNQTNDTTPGFAIETDSDAATVLVSVDGGAAQAAVRDSEGQWHFTVPAALADGEHNLVVTVTDTAGNSTSGEAFAFTVDTTLSLPVIDLTDASDSGADMTDNITNNTTPAFTLSNVDADAVTVEVLINGTVYPATQTGGIWGFTAPELTDGDYSVQVRVTDDAGNVAISGALNMTVDTAISAPGVTLSDDTGVAGDSQTNDTTPGFAIATDSDAATVLVSVDGGAAQAAVRDSEGQWHFAVPAALADGEHNLVVTVTDTAGNSTSGEAFAFTVDTTLSVPVIDLTDGSDTGASTTDNITNNTTPAFALSQIDADAVRVEVLINGTVYPATQTGGIWGFTAPELTDGDYAVQVRVTDDAGNVATSGAFDVTVDTAISAPLITLSDDTGVAGDNQTNDTTPGFAIATDSDAATVLVSVDGGAAQAAVRDSAGQWHFTVPSALTDGEHNLVVTVTDTAGNSISGEAFAFTVDTTLSVPVIDLTDASDSGADMTDNITNNTTPAFTLSQIAADAVTVEVLINGTSYPATQTGDSWSFTAPELADGNYAVQVRVTDDAGNVATSGALDVTVDTAISAPLITLSDDTGVAGDNQTNDTTPGFAIATDADVVTVLVSVDGGAAQAAVQDAAGQWHFTVPSALADGGHNLVVTVTDTAGNSTSGEPFAFTVDTTLSLPVIDLTDGSDTGAGTTDNITNNTTPAFALSQIDADAVRVEVLINGTVYPATQTGGIWSFTAPELTDGDYSVQVRVTDDAGNVATSGALDVTVDTAISAPVVTLSDDTGVTGDSQTNDTTPGFAIATDSDVVTVTVSVDGGAAQAAVRDAAGQWHFAVPAALADGEHNLVVTVTDTAGNSTSGEAFAFTVDTTLSVPVIDLTDASDSGADMTDNITNNTTPAFTLSNVDADAVTVEVLINGTAYPATKVGDVWGFTAPELTDGNYAVQVRVTDDAGNVATSGALDVTVDTAISAPGVTLSDDTGVAGDNQTNDTTPGFAIATDADVVTVLVSVDGGADMAAVRDSAGQWHFTVPAALADGEHNLVVTVTDTAGNSISGEAFAFTVDTTLSVPVIDLTDGSDTGASTTDNITNNTTPVFALSQIDADAVTVEVLINGTVYPATQTGGIWSFTAPELADGNYAVQVRVTDDAGNVATSGALNMTVDTAVAPVTLVLNAGSDTGASNSDGVTHDATPTFTFSNIAADMASLTLVLSNGAEYIIDLSNGNSFTLPVSLADGVYTATAVITDVAGNTASSPVSFTVDTQLTVPVIDLAEASDSGRYSTDNITRDTTPAFVLSSIDADVVTAEVLINGTAYPATKEGGLWGFTAPVLADGDYSVQVRVTDNAGNTATSVALNMTVDTAINAPVITLSDDTGTSGDNQTNDTTPGFAIVTDSDAATVMVSVDGGVAQTAVQDAAGQWHFTVPSALGDGNHSLSVTVTDLAGNSSANSLDFTIDSQLSVPTLALNSEDDSGFSNTDNLTNNTRPTFAIGNIDADVVSVVISLNGKSWPVTISQGAGTFTLPEALADGSYTVQLTVTDDAGNEKIITTPLQIDTVTSVEGIALNDDTGVLNDWLTNVTGPTFTLSAPADAQTVAVSVDGGAAIQATYSEGGWVINLPDGLSDGEHTLQVTVTDKAGNTAQRDQIFAVDTTLEPLGVDMLNQDDSGTVDDNITHVTTPRFSLTGVPEDVFGITVSLNGASYSVTPQSDGSWVFMPPVALDDGEYQLLAVVTDNAGNQRTTSFSFVIDTSVSIDNITLLNDTGDSSTDSITNAGQPHFNVATSDDVVTMTATINGIACNVTQTATGIWSVTSPVLTTPGDYTLTVNVTDVAGNQTTSTKTITFDNQLSQPVVSFVTGDDTGYDTNDHLTGKNRPGFVITNIDDDVTGMSVVLNGKTTQIYADGTGNWTFTPDQVLNDGTYTLSVNLHDRAGNTSSKDFTFTVDTTVAKAIITMDEQSDTGDSQTDHLTNNRSPEFTFTNIDADVYKVQVVLNGTTYEVSKDPQDAWHWTAPELAAGTYTLSTLVTDKAGNQSSESMTFVIDTYVQIDSIQMSADTGYADNDHLTYDSRPDFTIQVSDDVSHVYRLISQYLDQMGSLSSS